MQRKLRVAKVSDTVYSESDEKTKRQLVFQLVADLLESFPPPPCLFTFSALLLLQASDLNNSLFFVYDWEIYFPITKAPSLWVRPLQRNTRSSKKESCVVSQ